MSRYKFYNRKTEIDSLLSVFDKIVVHQRSIVCLLIRGKKGVGKSRLINELFNRVINEIDILSLIPDFTHEQNIIEYTCQRNTSAYEPFIKIAEQVRSRDKFIRVMIKSFRVLLAVFNINEILKSLEDVADAINSGEDSQEIRKKEIKTHNSYVRFIRRTCKKTPIIIFIRQSQFIDKHSLKLIRSLTDRPSPMWGAIILEEDTSDISEDVYNQINKLVVEQRITTMNVMALHKGFPAELLSERFHEGFINPEENDILFAISEGRPGKLIDFIESRCMQEGWIYELNGKWFKVEGFVEKIKPADQKLIELIISLFEDNELSESEYRLIKKMSSLWGLGEAMVKYNTDMVVEIMDSGYKILLNMGPGIVGQNSFVVADGENNRFVLEYLPIQENFDDQVKKRDVSHKNLLEAREIKLNKRGLFIIWDYFESKRTRYAFFGRRDVKLNNIIQKYKSIAAALSELHNADIAHGFLRPESIIEAEDGKFLLAAFNSNILNNKKVAEILRAKNGIHYMSPEQFKVYKPTLIGDIFSFGVLLYEELSNRLPFSGRNEDILTDSIRNDVVEFDSHLSAYISDELKHIIRKCLSLNPDQRYSNAIELTNDLDRINSDILPAYHPDEFTDPKPKTKSKEQSFTWKKIATLFVLAGFLTAGVWFLLLSLPKDVRNAITVEIATRSDTSGELDVAMLEYLIFYDLRQSSNKLITTPSGFKSIYTGRNQVPVIRAAVDLAPSGIFGGYQIDVRIKDNRNKKEREQTFDANHNVRLLTEDMFNISEFIIGDKRANNYVLTHHWDAFSDFYKGEIAWQSLNVSEAYRYFSNALDRDPRFLVAKLRLSEVLFFQGNNSIARSIVESIVENISLLSRADSIKTMALYNRLIGDIQGSINSYQHLISLLPERKDLAYGLAETYFQQRDMLNARRYYEQALQMDPNYAPAINHLAYCYTHFGEHERAIDLFKRYLEVEYSANAYDSYGDGLMAKGDYRQAAEAKLAGIALDPNLDYLHSSLGYIYLRMGKYLKAHEAFRQHLEMQNSVQGEANSLTNIAFLYYHKGQNIEAIRQARGIIDILFDTDDIVTGNHRLRWLLARLHIANGEPEYAIKELNRKDSLIQANNISYQNYNEILKYFMHISALLNPKNIDRIVASFDNDIEFKIKDWSSPYDLAYFNTEFGLIFLKASNYERAAERFLKALDYNPNYCHANYYLAKIYEEQGDDKKASYHKELFLNKWHGGEISKLNH